MILAIDCGNTNTVFALYSYNKNIRQESCWRINNDSKRTDDIYYPWLLQMLNLSNFGLKDITGVCIASVVPETLLNIKSLIKKYFELDIFNLKDEDNIISYIGNVSKGLYNLNYIIPELRKYNKNFNF